MHDDKLADLINAVQKSRKYHDIAPELISRIGRHQLQIRKNLKAAIKGSKNKLHQVAGAYAADTADYSQFLAALPRVANDMELLRPLCRKMMVGHASTAERLPILKGFYDTIFAAIPPVSSVLDLACGLNPLAWPWMGLSPQVAYTAIDIFGDMMRLIQAFFEHLGINGRALHQDILNRPPSEEVDLALILKSIPCLEQIDKQAGNELLNSLNARHILISYPLQSLGGRQKGMRENYATHFAQLGAGRRWRNMRAFEFDTEIAFLVQC